MELRDWAVHILSASRIEDKLFDPLLLTDESPGSAWVWDNPVRPAGMGFVKREKKDKLPPLHELGNPDKVASCLHRFAGHELLAVEIMAQALLAFPEAPKKFRMGVANTLREEQGHVRMYMERMAGLGISLGDLPLYRHFWSFVNRITCPVKYVSAMSLTFEMANLDFAPQFGAAFKRYGDMESYKLMEQILIDEVSHVRFGISWLRRLKEKDQDSFDAYKDAIAPMFDMRRSRGKNFNEEARKKAGVPENWIHALKEVR